MRRDDPRFVDVLEVLQVQHEQILRIFEDFKAASGAARIVPFASLKAQVRQHDEAEREVFYPAVEALGTAQAALITTAEAEHDTLETALAAIETAGAENASAPQVTALEDALKDHIRSERAVVFDAARKGLTRNQRRELGMNVGDYQVTSAQV
jgi:iron-sulfur cluster repair protein YtfE (RIC family)